MVARGFVLFPIRGALKSRSKNCDKKNKRNQIRLMKT